MRSIFLLSLSIATTAPAQSAEAPATATLAPDTEARWVSFDLTPGNQIRFALTLDGKTVTAILDTGVSDTVIARQSSAAHSKRVRNDGKATAIGGAVAIGRLPTREIAFGGLTQAGGTVAVADLPALATGSATAVDMLVGRDLTADYALDVDYANHRFRLLPSGRLPFRGVTAPLKISAQRRLYESAIDVGTTRLAPIVVDTGDGSALTLSQAAWRGVASQAGGVTTAVSFGLAGPTVNQLAIVDDVRVGDNAGREIETRIEPRDGFSETIGVAGRIGSGFLQRYRVLLDPGAGRMVLAPGPEADDAPLRSTSGLLLGVEPDKLKVLHVMARRSRGGERLARRRFDLPDRQPAGGERVCQQPAGTVVGRRSGDQGLAGPVRRHLAFADAQALLLTVRRPMIGRPAEPHLAAVLILLFAIAVRIWDFGNPVIHVDEQYYLLVGDRLLHGDLPYVDIWDRKPIGLFLLFAAIRLLPGDGIGAYQIIATLFAAATAWAVWRGARTLGAASMGALGAAAAYLLLLSLLGGRGGQAPVFYNLPVNTAILLTLRLPALAQQRAIGKIVTNGIAACALAGLAIQIKYTAAVEGAFVGCTHLWFLCRAGGRVPQVIAAAIGWALVGLAPTLAAIAFYRSEGPAAFAAFWFANFTSIALRSTYPTGQLVMRLLGIVAILSPIAACAWFAVRARMRDGASGSRWRIAIGWLFAAVGGFVSIGTFFDHYALPLIAPLAMLAAATFARARCAMAATLALAVVLLIGQAIQRPDDSSGARDVARIVARNSGGGCPYVFIGDTITYRLANACLPTAYAFPNLLAYSTEQGATGIDEAAEVRRILAARPPVIVTSDRRLSIWNPGSLRAVKAALARDYRPVFATPRAGYRTIVYLRRDRVMTR